MLNPAQGFCEVRTDSPSIARMAADHLIEHGFRNFLFCGFENCPWSLARENTFCRYVANKGFRCQSYRTKLRNWMDHADWVHAWGQEQPRLSAWLKSLPQPIGVMVCNDICGRLVLQACAEAALCVPRDIGVVGVDNDELLCELSDPPLSSVVLDLDRAGYEAAQLLDGLMAGQIKGSHVVMVNPLRVVTRRSSDAILQDDMAVADALRFIMDHAGQAIGVPDVVAEVGVSRRCLERRFSRATGGSMLGEITRCRLQRAQRLLRETNLPVYRVATESGFGSIKAFRRAFRLAETCSPSAFRFYSNQAASTDPSANGSGVTRDPISKV
jgi:LacI family transcriptional regulator